MSMLLVSSRKHLSTGRSFSSRKDILYNVGLSRASAQPTADTSTFSTYVFETEQILGDTLTVLLRAHNDARRTKKEKKFFLFSRQPGR
jgi:hypothetical protein